MCTQGYGENIYVYGNIAYQSIPSTTGNGFFQIDKDYVKNLNIFNNTIAKIGVYNDYGAGGITWKEGTTGNIFNNLWYECGTATMSDNYSHDYNWFYHAGSSPTEINGQNGTGDPFIDSANYDFRLKNSTNVSLNPSAFISADQLARLPGYNFDFAGTLRGQDGTWDRGAYEYVSNQSNCTQGDGDVDCNGQINSQDIQLTINIFLGTETNPDYLKRSDLSQDGKADILDIQNIINLVLNIQ